MTPSTDLTAAQASTVDTEPAPGSADSSLEPITTAFAALLDPTVTASSLGLGPLSSVRDELIELLEAQVGGEVHVIAVDTRGDIATVIFDVIVEGDTVILPAVELDFDQREDRDWTVTDASLCDLARGVGIDCLLD